MITLCTITFQPIHLISPGCPRPNSALTVHKSGLKHRSSIFQRVSMELGSSHDALRLMEILHQLTEAKDDEQQRSWHLHEDEDTLNTLLQDMFSILVCASSDYA